MSINPILAALGNQNQPTAKPVRPQAAINNPLEMVKQFANFKKAFADKDPNAVLEQLISSGKMTKEQLADLKREAEGLLHLLK